MFSLSLIINSLVSAQQMFPKSAAQKSSDLNLNLYTVYILYITVAVLDYRENRHSELLLRLLEGFL